MPYRRTYRRTHRRRTAVKVVSRETISVDGVSVAVTRKTMRNMYLRIDAGTGVVEVSAPSRATDDEIARFVRSHEAWLARRREQLKGMPKREWTDELKREARHSLDAQIPGLLDKWTAVVGREPTHITVRAMKSRWGSCTPATGRIRLNLQLGLMEPRFLEYVLVHELTHLRARGHGPEFQRFMDGYLPNWRVLRRDLNHHVAW